MAGQERLGRQTPSERQRLLRTQRSPTRVVSEVPTSSGMRRRQSHIPGQLPTVAAPPRPSPVPEPDVSVDLEDDDDQAETRLFRPQVDIAPTRRERTSSKAPVDDRPSRVSRPVSRPGALILIPADVPSVRVRSDSDIELMDTRMSDAGLVPAARRRRRSLSSSLLLIGAVIAVAMLVTHELALALHLPWLDPRTLFLKLGR
jgi:hypothetical protein